MRCTNMKQEITPENYRAEKMARSDEIRKIISENYTAFWNVAKRLQELEQDGIKIETPFGDFVIYPKKIID